MTAVEEKLPGFASALERAQKLRLTDEKWATMDRALVSAIYDVIANGDAGPKAKRDRLRMAGNIRNPIKLRNRGFFFAIGYGADAAAAPQ
jgi:hypothetical protein